MWPAFSSRTKRRAVTSLATSLRLFFLTASDMWHPYGGLTRNWSALDLDSAANTCRDIEWDDHSWNGCASSSLSGRSTCPAVHLDISCALASPSRRNATACQSLLALCHCAGQRGIERTNLQIGARPDKRPNSRAG